MWDIKDLDNLAKAIKDAFHLNHVGYKGKVKEKKGKAKSNFHLNHVGYKVMVC